MLQVRQERQPNLGCWCVSYRFASTSITTSPVLHQSLTSETDGCSVYTWWEEDGNCQAWRICIDLGEISKCSSCHTGIQIEPKKKTTFKMIYPSYRYTNWAIQFGPVTLQICRVKNHNQNNLDALKVYNTLLKLF